MKQTFDLETIQNLMGSVQEQLANLEKEAKEKVINAKSGGGLVDVEFNGAGELIDIKIDDELLQDKQSLQILLISALNEGYKKIEDSKKGDLLKQIQAITPFKF